MAREYGNIYWSFWASNDIKALSPTSKLLATYLLSSPHSNMIGCFRIPDGYIFEDLEFDKQTVSKGFDELFHNGFATRNERSKWVVIHKFLKWNQIENPNQGKSAFKLYLQVPDECGVKLDLTRHFINFGAHLSPEILEQLRNGLETLSKSGTGTGTGTGISSSHEGEDIGGEFK